MLCIVSYYYIYFAHFTYIPLLSLYLVTSTWSMEHIQYCSLHQAQYIHVCVCVFPHPRINNCFIAGVEGGVSLTPYSQNMRGYWGKTRIPPSTPLFTWMGEPLSMCLQYACSEGGGSKLLYFYTLPGPRGCDKV